MSEEGLERLRRVMAEHGITEHRPEGEAPPVNVHTLRLPALGPDERLANERCAICVGPLRSMHKVRVAKRQYAHPICVAQPQVDEHALRIWLALPLEVRRRHIIQHYGVDPVACEQMPVEVDFMSAVEDLDGLPVRMEEWNPAQRRVPTMGVPRCYWAVAEEEGWLTWNR